VSTQSLSPVKTTDKVPFSLFNPQQENYVTILTKESFRNPKFTTSDYLKLP